MQPAPVLQRVNSGPTGTPSSLGQSSWQGGVPNNCMLSHSGTSDSAATPSRLPQLTDGRAPLLLAPVQAAW